MNREDRGELLAMAQQKLRESLGWWNVWEKAIHKYRCWAMLYVSRAYALHELESTNWDVSCAVRLHAAKLAAHDQMLVAIDNAHSASECAVACEQMSRVYYEDVEGRSDDTGYSMLDSDYLGDLDRG